MRKSLTVLAAAAVWTTVSGAALAFEEVTVPPAEAPAPPPAQTGQPAPGLSFEAPERSATAPEGERGWFQGLRDFDFMPRMNFGLELLYGSDERETQRAAPPDAGGASPDDLSIMGTVRRRF